MTDADRLVRRLLADRARLSAQLTDCPPESARHPSLQSRIAALDAAIRGARAEQKRQADGPAERLPA